MPYGTIRTEKKSTSTGQNRPYLLRLWRYQTVTLQSLRSSCRDFTSYMWKSNLDDIWGNMNLSGYLGDIYIAQQFRILTFKSLAVSLRTTRFNIQKFYTALALR